MNEILTHFSERSELPKIHSINRGDHYASVNAVELSNVMAELGISDETIEQTTVIVDGKSRLGIKGYAMAGSRLAIARRRFPEHADVINGPVVRLSTTMRGKPRPPGAINKTLVHEAEHIAQFERQDPNVTFGRIAIYGCLIAGAAAGNLLTRHQNPFIRAAATFGGAVIGKEIGYRTAPSENQARRRSEQVVTTTVTMHSQ